MEDWQEAAFSSRHMHNRVGAHGKSKRHKPFDVQKVFGSYEIKCAAWKKMTDSTQSKQSDQSASLEIYRLTENGEGLIGELSLPLALNAAVIFAASRKSLQRTVSDVEDVEEETNQEAGKEEDIGEVDGEDDGDDDNDNDGDDGGHSDSDGIENGSKKNRFETFEKNSFRSPKFWFQWNGIPNTTTTNGSTETATAESGLGYIVFAGNDCRKFKGTINCSSFEWKDVSITGHKIASKPETDVPVAWLSNKNI